MLFRLRQTNLPPRWPFRVNRGSWQSDGLVGWWPLNTPTRDALSLARVGDRKTLVRTGTTPPARDPAGRFGVIPEFGAAGNDWFGVSPTFAMHEETSWPFTYAIWARVRSKTSPRTMIGTGRNNTNAVFIQQALNGPIRWVRVGGGSQNLDIVSSPALDVWYHLVVVNAAANDVRAYVNGGNRMNDTNTTSPSGGTGWRTLIGARPGADDIQQFDGWLFDARIYNRILSDAQVAALYEDAQRGRWELFESTGAVSVFHIVPTTAAGGVEATSTLASVDWTALGCSAALTVESETSTLALSDWTALGCSAALTVESETSTLALSDWTALGCTGALTAETGTTTLAECHFTALDCSAAVGTQATSTLSVSDWSALGVSGVNVETSETAAIAESEWTALDCSAALTAEDGTTTLASADWMAFNCSAASGIFATATLSEAHWTALDSTAQLTVEEGLPALSSADWTALSLTAALTVETGTATLSNSDWTALNVVGSLPDQAVAGLAQVEWTALNCTAAVTVESETPAISIIDWSAFGTYASIEPMAIQRIPILGFGTKPDTSGDVFFEPYSVKATADVWDRNVCIFNNTSSRIGLHGGFQVPQNYLGSAAFEIRWTSTATTGDVELDLDYRSIGGDDVESFDQTVQESLNKNDTAPSAAHERMVLELEATDGNFQAGDEVEFTLFRDGTDAGDTMTAPMIMFGLYFKYNGL